MEYFNQANEDYFVAMEYYMLILNRTYLIRITEKSLSGIVVNKLVSAGNPDKSNNPWIVKGDLTNPLSYIKEEYINNINLDDKTLLKANNTNFIIKRSDIETVWYDASKKWGMGPYPHDGKVYVKTYRGKTREFIILGNQSGQTIANLISLR